MCGVRVFVCMCSHLEGVQQSVCVLQQCVCAVVALCSSVQLGKQLHQRLLVLGEGGNQGAEHFSSRLLRQEVGVHGVQEGLSQAERGARGRQRSAANWMAREVT